MPILDSTARLAPAARRLAAALALAAVFMPPAARAADEPAAAPEYKDRLYVGEADGSNPRPLAHPPGFMAHGSPAWTRDGTLIAFDGQRPQLGEDHTKAKIMLVGADGANPRTLIDGAMPSFSPQAKRIAFSRYAPNNGVWIVSTEGPDAELVLLDEQGWGAEWSPDGSRIVYTKYNRTAGGHSFTVFNLVEGTQEDLFADETPYRQIFWNFVWSPDSKWVAFNAVRKDGKPELAIVDARGARYGHKTVVDGETHPQIGWSQQDKLIFARRSAEHGTRFRLYAVDPAKDEPPRHFDAIPAPLQVYSAIMSPDGKRLAYIIQNSKALTAEPKE